MTRRAPWLLLPLALAGCRLEMTQQRRMDTYEPTAVWPDGTTARPIPAGTVARGALDRARALEEPPAVTPALLARGQQRFAVNCVPCHGAAGDGDGMIVRRGFPPPPSFHTQRLRSAPARHVVDVITDGYGVMYSYAARVAPADRWAIAAYVRALQLSRHAVLAEAPDAAEHLPP
ncbi:c-type cytochrome [Roseomonas sp. BN140053]|uniref:c-type cytochrome n=1 Tax=Roseomonas sp. BN140053 TaxID=3391898 RepID=UPI0039EC0CD2